MVAKFIVTENHKSLKTVNNDSDSDLEGFYWIQAKNEQQKF